MMRNFVHHDPNWTYKGMNWNTFPYEISPIGHVLNSDNVDLSAFREQGGKLLLFHGWADVALSAHMSTNYVDAVYANDKSASDDVRLFMMPGVLHCAGGPGPSVVNWLEVIEAWHDSGVAPATLAASYPDKAGERKLCAWPKKAQYQSGNSESLHSYRCN